ncbi:MAG: preprotein translocase subunit SecA [Gammaproteobacteria bacterium]|nr:preprotein translocase subunit SecA [Gammaproteobacteria bacterium]
MIGSLVKKIFGSRNQRLIKSMFRQVEAINALEAEIESRSAEELEATTERLREKLAEGMPLDTVLPEAFAAVRESAKRHLGMRHFDVQLIGGITLHSGKIAEMKTGEGKTLVATLPAYLNALEGKGVHIVTVNEYLAERDANWMRPVFEGLGMTVGVIKSGQSPEEKREAYACDITYSTNNELGFDFLRDNMAFTLDQKVQRPLHFAIVDEVDSILIDEARTPLIISGPVDDTTDNYEKINKLVPKLSLAADEESPGDYTIDEKTKRALLTEDGQERIEGLLRSAGILPEEESLYDAANIQLMHHVDAALRAHALYKKDVDYIVQDGQVVIVDEFTGRTMPGRRWSDGLHQAVEAKEGVKIQAENQTLASITFQNYFRMYAKLSGMTGTADTEAYEFQSIYGLEVVVIPTNKPMLRNDMSDQIYLNAASKFKAIAEDIKDCRERGQPVLVGTTSIEVSELLSGLLDKQGIKHEVLNAKQHAREAEIVAQAGRPGAVTIATNMAGRGTDIVLGGNFEAELTDEEREDDNRLARAKEEWQERHDAVMQAGGLHIIGTERHESRRVDNQLRGRSGRQGDPGSTRFYLSMDDNLMRIFGGDRMKGMMERLGMQDDEVIENRWISKRIEDAQRRVEAHNFDIRKNLLEYDDVANDQRRAIYEQRDELMSSDDISETIEAIREDVVNDIVSQHIPPQSPEEMWDAEGLTRSLEADLGLSFDVQKALDEDDKLNEPELRKQILKMVIDDYHAKEQQAGSEAIRHLEKVVMLGRVDTLWKEHLAAMDYLRQGIHLRGYAQKNPKQEYKREAFEMFFTMLERIKHETVGMLSRVRIRTEEEVERMEAQRKSDTSRMQFQHADPAKAAAAAAEAKQQAAGQGLPGQRQGGGQVAPVQPIKRSTEKVGRNEPCPCGSGKKYKHCHGKPN